MKITAITKDNLEYFKGFISSEDAEFIKKDLKILPIGLVADDLDGRENMAAGAICCRPDDYSLDITSFYVSPEYRNRGAGKFLIDETRRLFAEDDMEFNIEFLVVGKEQEELTDFLEEYGFVQADPENEIYLAKVSDISKSKVADKEGDGEPFIGVKSKLFEEVENNAEKLDIILPLGGMKSEYIDDDISVAVVKDNKIESFVIFEKISEETILLSSAYSKNNSPTVLLHMLEKCAELILKKYSPDTNILVQSIDDTTDELMEKIFSDAKNVSISYRYVLEQ